VKSNRASSAAASLRYILTDEDSRQFTISLRENDVAVGHVAWR